MMSYILTASIASFLTMGVIVLGSGVADPNVAHVSIQNFIACTGMWTLATVVAIAIYKGVIEPT
jgi:hypothetical protein